MANACSVPTNGSDFGKYSWPNTNPVTVLYRKKSYHSIVVPIVLAITARLSCPRSLGSEEPSVVTKRHAPSLGTLDRPRPRRSARSRTDIYPPHHNPGRSDPQSRIGRLPRSRGGESAALAPPSSQDFPPTRAPTSGINPDLPV